MLIFTNNTKQEIGPGIFIAPDEETLNKTLSEVRYYNVKPTNKEITILAITPIVKSYQGGLGNGTIEIDTNTKRQTETGGYTDVTTGTNKLQEQAISLNITDVQYLIQYDLQPKTES